MIIDGPKSTANFSNTASLLHYRQTEICVIGQLGFVRSEGTLYVRFMNGKYSISGKYSKAGIR